MNSVINKKVKQNTNYKNVYIPFTPSDNGGLITELGGRCLEYFDNQNIYHLKKIIENTLDSEKTPQKLINYGYERPKLFSWKTFALKTINIYKKNSYN